MGTRADFYIGRGKNAEWLGSVAWDGYPSGIPAEIFGSINEAEYRHKVNGFIAGRRDGTLPRDGWPWPWGDSGTTDYAYCFDGSRVWFYGFPKTDTRQDKPQCWVALNSSLSETLDRTTPEEYPDMRNLKNVTFGPRSGVIVIKASKEGE